MADIEKLRIGKDNFETVLKTVKSREEEEEDTNNPDQPVPQHAELYDVTIIGESNQSPLFKKPNSFKNRLTRCNTNGTRLSMIREESREWKQVQDQNQSVPTRNGISHVLVSNRGSPAKTIDIV